MSVSRLTRIAAAAIALASSAVISRAQTTDFKFPDFSATQVLSSIGPGKFYHSGSDFRAEPVRGLVVIYLASTNKLYKNFANRNCIEIPPDKDNSVSSPLELLVGTKVERTPAGTEVVDGHSCKVENVVVTAADGTTTESKVWEAEDLKGAPLKIESKTPKGHVKATYQDVVLGTPDAALFKTPAKCVPYDKMYTVAPGSSAPPVKK